MHWSDKKFLELKAEGYKYAVRNHTPNYMSGVDIKFFTAEKIEDIYNAPFIKKWKDDKNCMDVIIEYKEHGSNQHLVRAFMKDGTYWVIGYFCNLKGWKDDNNDTR